MCAAPPRGPRVRTTSPAWRAWITTQTAPAATSRTRATVKTAVLLVSIETFRHRLDDGHLGTGEGLELRRAIFRLYALLKVHLAEEELYVSILDHDVEEERGDQLAVALRHVGAAEL